ncbi:MAG: DUF1549 domain-containing protein, partial [Planctomycetaceae bacterium]
MTTTTRQSENVPHESWALLEAVCEGRLTPMQAARLEELVLADPAVRRLYVDYIALHGTLHWDTAVAPEFLAPPDDSRPAIPSSMAAGNRSQRRIWTFWSVAATAACLLILLGAFAQRAFFGREDGPSKDLAKPDNRPANPINRTVRKTGDAPRNRRPINVVPNRIVEKRPPDDRKPVAARRPPQPRFVVPAGGSTAEAVIAYVNTRLESHWRIEKIRPSDVASDEEWVRRAYLDLIGRIPTVREVERFARNEADGKRRVLVDRLLEDPGYPRHWATVWSNLLVGRKPSRNVNRPAFERYLRDGFARNRPWKEMVAEMIAAEGPVDDNGAANFLVAHLNNQAVPATAVTARLFLGLQVQCTQCHNHPFNNWKQNQFWELNGFFKQTATQTTRSKSGRRVSLVNRKKGGPTYYEMRNKLIRAVYPRFGETQIDPSPQVNRRAELARLLFESENRQVARAMVNRMWAHFFGYGFTRPIDDMGPHNPPTHPELLDRLTDEFVASGYDVKRLIRWICNSRAYQLTSRFNDDNLLDHPAKGHLPLFSRMYVKQMSPEQLYDSLLVATKADRT